LLSRDAMVDNRDVFRRTPIGSYDIIFGILRHGNELCRVPHRVSREDVEKHSIGEWIGVRMVDEFEVVHDRDGLHALWSEQGKHLDRHEKHVGLVTTKRSGKDSLRPKRASWDHASLASDYHPARGTRKIRRDCMPAVAEQARKPWEELSGIHARPLDTVGREVRAIKRNPHATQPT
jgi:hypothetical protein